MADETEVQWKVIWFPPDKEERSKVASEAEVRRLAKQHEHEAPIIQRREVISTPWEVVENRTLGIVEEKS